METAPLNETAHPERQRPEIGRRGPLPKSGISFEAMQSVQRLRGALDALGHGIEAWRSRFAGEAFPETVLEALDGEISRAAWLMERAGKRVDGGRRNAASEERRGVGGVCRGGAKDTDGKTPRGCRSAGVNFGKEIV